MRPWKKLDIERFTASIRSSAVCADVNKLQGKSADDLFRVYDDMLRRIVDKHVPAHTASVRDRCRLSPSFDDDRRQSRRRSCAFERRYRRSCTANDWRGVDKSVPCTPYIPGQGESVLVWSCYC